MSIKKFLGFILLWFFLPFQAFAEVLCYFEGTVDFDRQKTSMYFDFPVNGKIFFYSIKESEGTLRFYLETDRLNIMLFTIMARMEGKLLTSHDSSDPDLFLQGAFLSPGILSVSQSSPMMMTPEGSFEVRNDRFYFRSFTWEGLHCEGYFGLIPPYDMDLQFSLSDVNLADFFSWISRDDIIVEGEISGTMRMSGFVNEIFIEGSLSSYDGQVDNFFYDYIVSEFEGVYPTVRLRRTNIAQREGVNVQVGGQIDLSKNFEDFYNQFTQLRIDPFIEERDVERQWIIRRERSQGRQGETKFHYRLRKTRETFGIDETDMFGIQRSIRF